MSARHIGLIAGGGRLPYHVAHAVRQSGEALTVIQIDGEASQAGFDGAVSLPLAKFGKILSTLKKAGVTHVCAAGNVARPDFSSFKPDLRAARYLPGTIAAARRGDDALMRHVLGIFEENGFAIVSAQSLCEPLLLPDGPLGRHSLTSLHRADAERAMDVARIMGEQDIGQGAVVASGVVLAVEAQEGTDAMLTRVAALPEALRGHEARRVGVLAKRVKPHQDIRVDMPTLGPATVRLAANAGLAGIMGDAGGAFVLDRDETVRLADELGLFIIGLPGSRPDGTP